MSKSSQFEMVETSVQFNKLMDRQGPMVFLVHSASIPECVTVKDTLSYLVSNEDPYYMLSVYQVDIANRNILTSPESKVSVLPTLIMYQGNRFIDKVEGADVVLIRDRLLHLIANTPLAQLTRGRAKQWPVAKSLSVKSILLLVMKDSDAVEDAEKRIEQGKATDVSDVVHKKDIDGDTADKILSSLPDGCSDASLLAFYHGQYMGSDLQGVLQCLEEMKSHPKTLKDRLHVLVNSSPVMLFMKGDKQEQRCGFSKKAIALMTKQNVSYDTFNILDDTEVRQGLKDVYNWPTYPQLYVDGKLVGGIDILEQMHEAGALKELFKPYR